VKSEARVTRGGWPSIWQRHGAKLCIKAQAKSNTQPKPCTQSHTHAPGGILLHPLLVDHQVEPDGVAAGDALAGLELVDVLLQAVGRGHVPLQVVNVAGEPVELFGPCALCGVVEGWRRVLRWGFAKRLSGQSRVCRAHWAVCFRDM